MVKRREVVKFFQGHGFVNKGGSKHDKVKHPDGRWTEIPRHTEINDLLFEQMKKQAGLK
ncbi:MAG: type II toxin-antitoxin system HicA family toxin [Coriobacteriia bacterium]|nr:type II toxin-antitoxin system HicA family toxin [Coriobacteriia bacterium]